MKHIKTLTAILLALVLLTGCEFIYPESSDGESSSSESLSESTSSESLTVSYIHTEPNTPEPPEIKPVVYPEMELKLSSEMVEIMGLFGDLGAFYYEYLGLEPAWERVISGESADGFSNENAIYFGKVINGDITTYSMLMEKLKSMLTDKCIEETSEYILNFFRTNENDELFLRSQGAGGYLGSDYIRINSIDYPDNETIALDMSTVGEKEHWGLEEDWIDDFKITLKKTDSGLRIDEIDGYPYFDFAYLNCVVYNNVNMVPDNDPEYVKKAHEESGWQRPLNETEEIIKLLEDYSDINTAQTNKEVLGMDKLYLNSIEYPDDDTILVTVTSFDSNNNVDTAFARIIRTDDGLRIGKCSPRIADYFSYYNEIIFDNIP